MSELTHTLHSHSVGPVRIAKPRLFFRLILTPQGRGVKTDSRPLPREGRASGGVGLLMHSMSVTASPGCHLRT